MQLSGTDGAHDHKLAASTSITPMNFDIGLPGSSGVIGRRISIMSDRDEILGEGIIGWN